MSDAGIDELTLLDKVFKFQNALIAQATGSVFDGGDENFKRLRLELLDSATLRGRLPDFVRRCRDTNQFWQFIKHQFPSYAERRNFIWSEFAAAIEYLEQQDRNPGAQPIAEAITRFDADAISGAWQKALDRRGTDPEGAITAARTLLESVCKHILDDLDVAYADDIDLPKLWFLCAEKMKLAPQQHQEEVFKSILGNCQSVVNNLAAIRNKIGDAHGIGRKPVRPSARHAELAVNLSGTMASFLIATLEERRAAKG